MNRKTIQITLIIIYIFSLALIWGQSCVSKEESETTSDVLVDIIKPLEEIKPDDEHTVEYEYYNHLIRKGAHVIEFSFIGLELALIIIFFGKKKQKIGIVFVNSVMTGMLIGLIDETIQIFSNRGTQVSDIWFDVIGTGLGAFIVSMLYAIKKIKSGDGNEKNIDYRIQ